MIVSKVLDFCSFLHPPIEGVSVMMTDEQCLEEEDRLDIDQLISVAA